MARRFFLFALCTVTMLAACASEPSVTFNAGTRKAERVVASRTIIARQLPFPAGEVTGLVNNTIFDIILQQGSAKSVAVRGPENIVTRVVSLSLKEGLLYVSTPGNINLNLPDEYTPVVYVTLPEVSSLSLESTGDIEVTALQVPTLSLSLSGTGDIEVGTLQVPTLSLSLSGTGDIEVQSLTAGYVDAVLSGTGDIDVRGTADTLNAVLSGTGDLELEHLAVQNATVVNSGTGDADCRAVNMQSTNTGTGEVRNHTTSR